MLHDRCMNGRCQMKAPSYIDIPNFFRSDIAVEGVKRFLQRRSLHEPRLSAGAIRPRTTEDLVGT